MDARLAIVLAYLLAMGAIGLVFQRAAAPNPAEFFLAGRRIGPMLLFFTMAATNFSAFTIFGLSGAGYRIGYGFWPVMGFGTGFMALSFLVVGGRIMLLSKERGYITPADFVADRYGAPWLKKVFSGVMILYTLPYVAIQAVAAGRSLEQIAGIPYFAGASLVVGCVVLYVTLGGMRSVAWTDVIQALMMIGFTAAAYVVIVRGLGGFLPVHERLAAEQPAAFARPGLDGSLRPGVWLGYLVLWLCADPMFPQLFQRLIAARDRRALAVTACLYPLITTGLFFITVSIGVLGRGAFPTLSAAQSESVFPMLLGRFASPALATLLLTGGLAALMSTLDSQLLTLTSMVTVDFIGRRTSRVLAERLIVVLIGATGLAIAARPPATIFDFVNGTTFNGVAVLAPTVVGGLFWRRANRWGALASITVGEAAVVAFYFRLLRVTAVLPVIPIMAAATLAFVAVSVAAHGGEPARPAPSGAAAAVIARAPGRRAVLLALPFAALFLLANDFWAWNRAPLIVLGLPAWAWYFAGLGILLSLGTWLLEWRVRRGVAAPARSPGASGPAARRR